MIDLEFVGDYRNPQQLTARQRELGFDGSSAGDFTFDDFLDIINPLQHIPVVSTLYREITGDEISPHARIFGGALFGGPSGFISAAANTLFDEVTGSDIGETLVAAVIGEDIGDAPQFAEAAEEVLPAAAPLDDPAAPGPKMTTEGMLTGNDALAALFNDLRGTRAPAAALGDNVAPKGMPLTDRGEAGAVRSYPLPPRSPHAASAAPPAKAPGEPMAAHPLMMAQEAGDAGIAQQMMQALDKYQAMSQQRHQGYEKKSEPARPGDEAQWQSDPLPGGDS